MDTHGHSDNGPWKGEEGRGRTDGLRQQPRGLTEADDGMGTGAIGAFDDAKISRLLIIVASPRVNRDFLHCARSSNTLVAL